MSNYSVPKKVNESADRPCKVSALFALIFVLSSFLMANKPVVAQTLSLEQALQLAIQYDPLLKGNAHRKDRFNAEAEASSYWANPQVSASVQNLPTDGFAFDQEPMTQFKVGLKQQLPRGDENLYSQQKYQVMADQMSVESQARKAWLKREVTLTWLNWVYATRRLGLLDKEKLLLTQLLDFTESRYSQGVGAAAQQDILQVRLALLSLDDKYVQAYQQKNEARSALSKWFGAPLDESVSAPLTQSTQDAIEVDAILNDSNLSLSLFLTVIESSEPFSILQHHPEATLR